jgi:hypothetical protein
VIAAAHLFLKSSSQRIPVYLMWGRHMFDFHRMFNIYTAENMQANWLKHNIIGDF